MKIELSKDSLFDKLQSSSVGKDVRSKQREKLRLIKNQKMNSSFEKPQINIQVIDPLPQQLIKYKKQIQYKRTHEVSKASHVLKKYIIEQERNLKRIRLEKLDHSDEQINLSPKRSQLHVDIDSSSQKSEKNPQQINIPKIQQVFKNQQKQYVLFESKLMRDRLKKAYNTVQNGVKNIKQYYKGLSTVPIDSRKTSFADKFPPISNPEQVRSLSSQDNEYEIDKIIQRKLTMSKKLRDKLYQQKRLMMSIQAKQSASKSKSINFYIQPQKKSKKKIPLEGVKAITLNRGNQKIKVTPASSLLFSLNRMSVGHQKKEEQLEQLVHNSYFNRNSTLSEKSDFYDQQTPFSDLSPSNQFRLRKLMDKKLIHRLQLSKQQINKFCQYLFEIKNSYHVILNDQILEVLKQIRQILLTGKVMKYADLSQVLKTKDKKLLIGHPNQLILQKLSEMMI